MPLSTSSRNVTRIQIERTRASPAIEVHMSQAFWGSACWLPPPPPKAFHTINTAGRDVPQTKTKVASSALFVAQRVPTHNQNVCRRRLRSLFSVLPFRTRPHVFASLPRLVLRELINHQRTHALACHHTHSTRKAVWREKDCLENPKALTTHTHSCHTQNTQGRPSRAITAQASLLTRVQLARLLPSRLLRLPITPSTQPHTKPWSR